MNRIAWFLPLLLVVALGGWGCRQSAEEPVQPAAVGEAAEGGGVFLCGACGQIKGSDDCCKQDAAKCAMCELAEGSPGCCKIAKGTDAKVCTKCGQVAGSENCCKPDAVKCAKCGLAEGSPGCCKIDI